MAASQNTDPHPQICDYCGSEKVEWLKCKLICRACRQIVMSCADLLSPEFSAPG